MTAPAGAGGAKLPVLSSGTERQAGSSGNRPQREQRGAYRAFRTITTRWMDNDAYGHVNNVVFYSWFDTAVNAHLVEQGALDIQHGDVIGLVVETGCNYFLPVAFPQPVEAGLRVAHIGRSSVRYDVAVFVPGQPQCVASGHFVHVYVDRASRRPCELPVKLKSVLEALS